MSFTKRQKNAFLLASVIALMISLALPALLRSRDRGHKIFNIEYFTRPIGYLDVGDGANVRYFTTKPGSRGKPNTIAYVTNGVIEVYSNYDWAEHYDDLAGQEGHKWFKVSDSKSYWVYGLSHFKYIPVDYDR